MLMQQKQKQSLMRALRRSHTSSSPSPSPSPSSNTSPPSSSSASSSSTSSSWIHLRSVFLVVAPSSTSPVPSNRGTLKSPWSRRRRKHALLPKQWKSFFLPDGKLCDGGVKFLKKVRSGGVDPTIRAEVWPFLLGVYGVNSSKEERESIKCQNRKKYENLRKQCRQIMRRTRKKKNGSKENVESIEQSGDLSQVMDSGLDDSASLPASPSSEKEGFDREGSQREVSDREGSEREGFKGKVSETEGSGKEEVLEREGSEIEVSEKEVSLKEVSEREGSGRDISEREGSEGEASGREGSEREAYGREASESTGWAREVLRTEGSERGVSEKEGSERKVSGKEGSEREVPERQGSVSEVSERDVVSDNEVSEREGSGKEVPGRQGSDSKHHKSSTGDDELVQVSQLSSEGHFEKLVGDPEESVVVDAEKIEVTFETRSPAESESTDSDSSEFDELEIIQPFLSSGELEGSDLVDPTEENLSNSEPESRPKSHTDEDFATWQRIIRLDAIRANSDWAVYFPSQASITTLKARRLAESVGLKDYDHLEPCRIFHAARLLSILEAYAIYDPEIGYCQGMSDLLSPIVSVIEDDSEAFWCFVGFMKKARHNFRLDEVGIRRQLNIVSKIIKCKDSHLYSHLEKLKAEDCFFVYRMVVVLFRRELSFDQTLCLWEVMWADQAAIRAGIARSAWGRMRLRAPPSDDLLLYAIAASVLQRRKLIIEKYSSMEEIMRECNSMAGHLDVWKLLDDAHDLVVNLNDKI